MATYNVTAGADLATIELEEETKVVFSFVPNIIAVRATDGDITLALNEGAESGEDGVRTVKDGTFATIKPVIGTNYVWINGSATAEVWAGDSAVDCPFKKKSKGGDSGGVNVTYSETAPEEGDNGDIWFKTSTVYEYLQSTGAEYIDTDVLQNYDIGLEVKFKTETYQDNAWVLGAGIPNAMNTVGYYDNKLHLYLSERKLNIPFDTDWHTYKLDSTGEYLDGTATGGTGTLYTSNRTIYLFAMNYPSGTYNISTKIAYCKLWRGDELMRNFVPYVDANNIACMYDTKTNTAFYNASGSGAFTAGRATETQVVLGTYIRVNGAWVNAEGREVQ